MLHPPRTLRFWHRNKPAKKFPALHGQKNPHLPQGRPEVSLLRCKSRHHPTAEEQSFHIPGAPSDTRKSFPGCILQALASDIFLLLLSCVPHRSAHPPAHTRLRAPASSVLLHQVRFRRSRRPVSRTDQIFQRDTA